MMSLCMRVALLAARLRDLRLAMRAMARIQTAGASLLLDASWTRSRRLSMTSSGEGGRSGLEDIKERSGKAGRDYLDELGSDSGYILGLFLPSCRANALSRAPSPPWRPAMRSSRTIPSLSVGLCVVSMCCRLTPAVLGASGDLAKKKVCPSALLHVP